MVKKLILSVLNVINYFKTDSEFVLSHPQWLPIAVLVFTAMLSMMIQIMLSVRRNIRVVVIVIVAPVIFLSGMQLVALKLDIS